MTKTKLQKNISCAEKELKELENKKQADTILLENYIEEGKKQYKTQRAKIVRQINSNNLSPYEKTLYIIFLGILEKDCQKIIGENP